MSELTYTQKKWACCKIAEALYNELDENGTFDINVQLTGTKLAAVEGFFDFERKELGFFEDTGFEFTEERTAEVTDVTIWPSTESFEPEMLEYLNNKLKKYYA